jgi:hypothetical protein
MKVDSGSKVTVPSEFAVYVPSPEIATEVSLQFTAVNGAEGTGCGHNFIVDADKVTPDPAESFVRTSIV